MLRLLEGNVYKVDNAVIMAAGMSSRFAPLSYEKPKALIEVKGEVLIERQIRQLIEAEIPQIYIVVGYKAEQFEYLQKKFGVCIVRNEEYLTRNNNGSIYAVKDIIRNTYICSADNYFNENPFEKEVEESYYAAVYANGATNEWCMQTDDKGYISQIDIGGRDAWYMLGHAFWSEEFSKKFIDILMEEYSYSETRDLLWEGILNKHLSQLKMMIRKYPNDYIYEFDTLDELRLFDNTYVKDTRSEILKDIAKQVQGAEEEIKDIVAYKNTEDLVAGIRFVFRKKQYNYNYLDKKVKVWCNDENI